MAADRSQVNGAVIPVKSDEGGDGSVSETTITISAMVRVGPWIVEAVQHGPWRRCDRCDARHREVWICTLDEDVDDVLGTLNGKRTWHIGSTCGPKLMLVSEQVWSDNTKGLARDLHLLLRARSAIAVAVQRQYNGWTLPLIIERTELLRRRELPDHLTCWLSSHVNRLWNDVRPDRKTK